MQALGSDRLIGVVGAGTMGAGIAQVAAAAGHPVVLQDTRPAAAAEAVTRIRSGLQRVVDRGRMSAGAADAVCARIRPADGMEDFAGCALVIEAIVEDLDAKQSLLRELESICGEDALLATNTSSLSVTAIGAGLRVPGRLVGMHFFNPAPILRLVEIVRGAATTDAAADTAYATARGWGKVPVHARSTPGFIVNRVARPFYAEALRVLEEGAATPATIDALLREVGGYPMGPFELMDLIGHDVNYAVTCSMFHAHYADPRFLPSLRQKELVDAGWLGRKSGRGFYRYAPEPEVREVDEAPEGPACADCRLHGEPESMAGLVEALVARGIRVAQAEGPGLLRAGAVTLAPTDGRMATVRARDEGVENLVLYDYCADYAQARRIALAPAEGTTATALADACGLFQSLGARVSVIGDTPGMVVMRTLCMLANEAAESVLLGICSAAACDAAMRHGLNHDPPPLARAAQVGPGRVVHVLGNLQAAYGLDRYRPSLLLQRHAATGHAIVEVTQDA